MITPELFQSFCMFLVIGAAVVTVSKYGVSQ